MKKTYNQKSAQSGFTLVELSIVLVIIGLIIGGVLTGQALIQAAKVRAQLTQIEQLDTAMNAFRSKFDCLPGDCPAASGVVGASGDGDGLVLYTSTWSATLESALVFSQMAAQNMFAGSYTPAAGFSKAQVGEAKLGTGGSVIVGSGTAGDTANTNFYVLAKYAATGGSLDTGDLIPADAARSIDSKRDDGLPHTGSTRGIASDDNPFDAANVAVGTTNASCVIDTGSVDAYQAGVPEAICIVRTRISG